MRLPFPRPFMESFPPLPSFHLQHTFGCHLCTFWSSCFCQYFRPGSSGKPGSKTFHKRGPILVLPFLWNVLNISFHSLQVSVPILTLFVLSEKYKLNCPIVACEALRRLSDSCVGETICPLLLCFTNTGGSSKSKAFDKSVDNTFIQRLVDWCWHADALCRRPKQARAW